MTSVGSKVAVIGSGISGAVCASILAKNGISVTVFESARGPGGRMSQRREVAEDGRDLLFDLGAPYFTALNPEVLGLVHQWELRGLVAHWNTKFGSFDCISRTFLKSEEDESGKKYIGVPGMNAICRALLSEPGVESIFQVGIGKLEWLDFKDSWSLIGLDGRNLGEFEGVVASDKNIFSTRFTNATGRSPPLDLNVIPEITAKIIEIPVVSCFTVMLAFEQPLSSVPVKGFSIKNSEILSRAFCDSSKPGRSTSIERWVLHSTSKYADHIIGQTGLQKPSIALLSKVADELFQEFQTILYHIPKPFFKKAHRWGSAFPGTYIAADEKCVWNEKKRMAICGDFCVGANVEGAITSAMAAASKFVDIPIIG